MEDDRVIQPVRYVPAPSGGTNTNSGGSFSNTETVSGNNSGGSFSTLGNEGGTASVNYAAGSMNEPGVINPDLGIMELVQMAVVYAFIVAAVLSAIFIFVGGISFILSGGNDEKIKQAINTIRYSIIGLIIVILSFAFVTIVGRMFGLNFMDYIKYSEIRQSINRLLAPSEQSVENFQIQP